MSGFVTEFRIESCPGVNQNSKCKNEPEADALRKQLDEWKKNFEAWFRQVAKQEPPKG
jgi:hypothetical protein